MKNLINTFLETSKDRLKNPLIGTFIFAWLAMNWKPITILILSSDPIYYRIDIIEECYSSLWFNLFLPLLITMFYLLAVPYVMWLFDLVINLAVKKRQQNLINLRLSELDGKKELAAKESEIEDIKSNYLEKSELNKKINELETDNNQKDLRIKEIETELIELRKKEKDDSSTKKVRNQRILDDINKKKYDGLFEELIDLINNDNYVPLHRYGNINNYFLRLGVIEIDKSGQNDDDSKKYSFTTFGKTLVSAFIDSKMN